MSAVSPTPLETRPALDGLAGVTDVDTLGPGGMPCGTTTEEALLGVVSALRDDRGFTHLSCLTAVDGLEALEMVYVLTRPDDRAHAAIKVPLSPSDARVPSLVSLWAGAEWLEREVYDLFGVTFTGHPDLRRILLLDDFAGHPLRKSFVAGEPAVRELPQPGSTLGDEIAEAAQRELFHHAPPVQSPVVGAGLRSERIILNMGPQHPSTHGVLHLLLALEGEVVTASEPSIGYLHRCIEKLCESHTYKQCIPMLDRADYVSGFHTELAFCLAAEELAGIEVPPKADYLRVLFGEMCRITSHLVWLGAYGADLGAITPFLYCFREREAALDLFEEATGARMMFNYFRVGGVKADLPPGLAEKMRAFLGGMERAIDEYEALLTDNEIFRVRTCGVGPITARMIEDYCVTGPMARASGVDVDLRRDEPYAAYGDFDVAVPTATNGDCFDRYVVRVAEMRESTRLALAALDGIPEGDHIASGLPRTLKPPAGEAYRRVESPRGELGIYLVSDGSAEPWRMKLRSPALSNLHVVPATLEGRRMGDVVAVIGSVDVVMGEIDR